MQEQGGRLRRDALSRTGARGCWGGAATLAPAGVQFFPLGSCRLLAWGMYSPAHIRTHFCMQCCANLFISPGGWIDNIRSFIPSFIHPFNQMDTQLPIIQSATSHRPIPCRAPPARATCWRASRAAPPSTWWRCAVRGRSWARWPPSPPARSAARACAPGAPVRVKIIPGEALRATVDRVPEVCSSCVLPWGAAPLPGILHVW